ncbi:RDD family protein [Dactylosporangium sp. NPDC048998]|uniref:RDD family protein n=1 Tax=Dactylosporangium sp. NPDC048998 TaxID=3363976 RepID=UPI00371A1977
MPRAVVAIAPDGRPVASFADRLLAFLIDTAVLAGVNIVLLIPTMIAIFVVIAGAASKVQTDPVTGEVTSSPSAGVLIGVPLLIELGYVLLTFVAAYVYYVEMFGRTGVTWGKRAMKLQLIRAAAPAAPIDRGVLVKRWAVQFPAGLVLPFFSWVDGLWQLWDKPYQQCLHDKAAGTIVVKVG